MINGLVGSRISLPYTLSALVIAISTRRIYAKPVLDVEVASKSKEQVVNRERNAIKSREFNGTQAR